MSKFMERKFKGIFIDRELYLDAGLSWTEKILLIEIDSLDNEKEKGCFASNQYLADFLGVKLGSLKNLITKLKKKGLVSEVCFDGRRRGLTTYLKSKRASQKSDRRGHKKVTQPSQKNDEVPSQKNDNSKTSKEFLVKQEKEAAPPLLEIHIANVLAGVKKEFGLTTLVESVRRDWESAARNSFDNDFSHKQFLECLSLLRKQDWRTNAVSPKNVITNLPNLDRLRKEANPSEELPTVAQKMAEHVAASQFIILPTKATEAVN